MNNFNLSHFFTQCTDLLLCVFNDEGIFEQSNQTGATIFTLKSEKLKGASFLDWVHPEDHRVTLQALQQYKTCQTVSFENRLRIGHQYVRYAWIFYKKEPHRIQAIASPIDQRCRIQEITTYSKNHFLANMSHEIRTPMNGVIGMIELLQQTELTGKQKEYIEFIQHSADILQSLINNILDFSKIEANKLILEPIPFNLETVVLEVARLLSVTARTKGFEIIVRYAPNAPRYLIGDVGRVRQILINLVSNAIKFTQEGHVLIDVSCEAHSHDAANMVISVKDTGIGIPEDKLTAIANQFAQTEPFTIKQAESTGLGLAISHQLVKMMWGTMTVKSQLDQGTVFTFTLWLLLTETEPVELPLVPPDLTALEQTQVLIIGDDLISRYVITEQLESMKIHWVTVNNSLDALLTLNNMHTKKSAYWLVITDDLMLDAIGEKLRRRVKEKSILLMMLSSTEQHLTQLRQIGFAAYLVKPLSLSRLQKVLMILWQIYNKHYPLDFITLESLEDHAARIRQFERVKKNYHYMPVLLVEDNEVNRMVAFNMLVQLGCQVTEAVDGQEAIELLHEREVVHKIKPFAIIFMDIQMPKMNGFEATQLIRQTEKNRHKKQRRLIVAMTANAMQGDAERCLNAGMDDYISKPITLERIADMLEKYCSAYECNHFESKAIRDSTYGKRTLLVEDNQVNCIVATNILKSFGCYVDVMVNGKEAVDICTQRHYDLILMDIQMPVMDGIEATQHIQHDRNSLNRNTPIVAVTANVMQADVEYYLANGINEYVAKPINAESFCTVLKRYMPNLCSKITTVNSPPLVDNIKTIPASTLATFDAEQAKQISIGNVQILKKIVSKMLEDTPKQLEKLAIAMQAQDMKTAERLAHSIKGSARSVGALQLGELALLMEQAIKSAEYTEANYFMPQLMQEFEQLQSIWTKINWDTFL